jgi:putative ABC transport system permease protein
MTDLRLAIRLLARERTFGVIAVVVLALGIGGVTTMFSVVNAVLLRGLPFPQQDRLVDLNLVDPVGFAPPIFSARQALVDFEEIEAAQLKSFASVAAYIGFSTVNLNWQNEPRRYNGGYVTHNFFRTLGVKPALGRDFAAEEDRPGATHSILLGDALWRSDFGADPGVVGRSVTVNGKPAVIIGVMPRNFVFPFKEQLWLPLRTEFGGKGRADSNQTFPAMAGRLRDGVSLAAAQDELSALARSFAAAHPATNGPFNRAYVRPLFDLSVPVGLSPLLWTMLSFCFGVLVLACVNVMNMQFARATARGREFAIRSSLGAGVGRLVRQMLVESLVLSSLGAVGGIALAFWTTDLLRQFVATLPNSLPEWMVFDVDARVLFLVVGATAFSAVLSAIIPALLAARGAVAFALKSGGRGLTGSTAGRWTRGLVTFQLFITSLLLVAALLQILSINRQLRQDHGFDPQGVATVRIALMAGSYPSHAVRREFYDRLLRELRATPGLEAAAFTSRIRSVIGLQANIEIEGRTYAQAADRTIAQAESISAGYHGVMRQKIVAGRGFNDEDNDQRRPVAVVNATFARKHFPGESALGRRFRTANPDGSGPGPWREIVGVVGDVRMLGPLVNALDNAGYYVPHSSAIVGPAAAAPLAFQFTTIIARPGGGQRGEAAIPAIRAALKRLDPDLPPYFVETPADAFANFLGQNRLVAALFAVFGGIATVLAAAGLYGVTTYAVHQRTREFGVRLALGALPRQILDLVLRQGGRQLVFGLAGGLALALLVALIARDTVAGFLFRTSPLDPVVYAVVAVVLAAVSLAATLIPALSSTKVDPVVALRHE